MNGKGTSYLLWLACMLGVSGLHRFYNKKPLSGVLWLVTWGFFGIGNLVDLFLIPNMVEEHNHQARTRRLTDLLDAATGSATQPAIALVDTQKPATRSSMPSSLQAPPTRHQLMLSLLKAAETRGGKLSVTQAVLDTGLTFEDTESILKDMVKSGYVAIENHPATGVILYNFLELS